MQVHRGKGGDPYLEKGPKTTKFTPISPPISRSRISRRLFQSYILVSQILSTWRLSGVSVTGNSGVGKGYASDAGPDKKAGQNGHQGREERARSRN